MSIRVSTLVWERSTLTGTDLLLLLAIADQANDDGEAWPSKTTLQEKIRVGTVDGLKAAIKRVKATGELLVTADPLDTKRNMPSIYTVNVPQLLAQPQRYHYSRAAREAARAAARAGGVTVDTPAHLGGNASYRGGEAELPGGGKPSYPKTSIKTSINQKDKDMSAHADTQVGGSSQEGQEGQGKKAPESQPTQAKRKARKASTAASTGEGSAAAARLVELWNEHRGTLGAVRLPMSDARLKLVSRVVDLNTAQGLTAEEAEARWVAAVRHVVAGGWYKKKGYGIDNLCRNFEANASTYDAGQGQGNTNPRRLDNARKYADDQ